MKKKRKKTKKKSKKIQRKKAKKRSPKKKRRKTKPKKRKRSRTKTKRKPKKKSKKGVISSQRHSLLISDEPHIAKRQNPRVPLKIKIDYYQDPGVYLYDYSRNLGRGGIFIESPNPMPPGTELYLNFTLPHQTDPIEVKGTVVWIHETEKEGPPKGIPGMGIQFFNPEGKAKKALDEYFREVDGDDSFI